MDSKKNEYSYTTLSDSASDERYNCGNTAVFKTESAANENTVLLTGAKNDGLELPDVSRGAWISLVGATCGMLTTFGYVVVIGMCQV